jgi:hypothetical protein
VAIFLNVYYLTTFIIFSAKFIRKSEFVRKRSTILAFLATILGMLSCNLEFLVDAADDDSLPCLLAVCGYIILLPLWFATYILRSFQVVTQYVINQAVKSKNHSETTLTNAEKSMHTINAEETHHLNEMDAFILNNATRLMFGDLKTRFHSNKHGHHNSFNTFRCISFLHLIGKFALLQISICILCICVSPNKFLHYPRIPYSQCDDDWEYGYVIPYGLLFLIYPLCLYLIRSVRDSYFLRYELFLVLLEVLSTEGVDSIDSPVVTIVCISLCHTFSITVPATLAIFETIKNQRLALTQDYKSFYQVISNARSWAKLKNQVAKDLAMENCMYLEAVSAFKGKLVDEGKEFDVLKDEHERKYDDICNKFIFAFSEYELNLNANKRLMKTENKTCIFYLS